MASAPSAECTRLFASSAWIAGAWASDVLLELDAGGNWSSIQAHVEPAERVGATFLPGPVLPGLVNAHSHAFQRCMAGLTERRDDAGAPGASDDFWSWRERMYSAANRITPDQMEAIASFLYAELLAGGYTHVCEFHYLHNDLDGKAYAEPAELSLALVRAARSTGIGLTLLPTLYMRSGFGVSGLREDQRRFASTPERLLRLVEHVEQAVTDGSINVALAIHSLRAVDPGALQELVAGAGHRPIHIHIAEQQQEVADCLAHTGRRPIEWLLEHAHPGPGWNLVHATHTTAQEIQGMARCGAAVVICPSTEANLGDGVFDLPGYAAAGGRWSIGSDSHVCRDWAQELQLLEYSQRLALRQRNVAARVLGLESSAAGLFEAALAGGAQASGRAVGGLVKGQRADFIVLDPDAPALLGLPAEHALDGLVFAGSKGAVEQTWVGGRRVWGGGARGSVDPASPTQTAERYRAAMAQLWAT